MTWDRESLRDLVLRVLGEVAPEADAIGSDEKMKAAMAAMAASAPAADIEDDAEA